MNKKVSNLRLFLWDNTGGFLFFTYLTELHCFLEHLIIVFTIRVVCIVQVFFMFTVYNATNQSDKLKVC